MCGSRCFFAAPVFVDFAGADLVVIYIRTFPTKKVRYFCGSDEVSFVGCVDKVLNTFH
jgi:hypothetical protein